MKKSFLGFNLVFAGAQLALGFIATKLPDWAGSVFLSKDGQLWYVLRSELRYDVVALSLLVIFSPQIVLAFRYFIHSIVQISFLSPHLILKRKFFFFMAAIICCLGSSMFFGLFLQSIAAYAAVVVHEVQNYEDISRQRLINVANTVEATSGPIAALPIYQRVLRLFPDDDRNPIIERKIRTATDQNAASRKIMSRAQKFQSQNEDILAIQAYRSALAIFPYNSEARQAIMNYQARFAADRSNIESFYVQCRKGQLGYILDNIDGLWFSVRDITSAKKLSQSIAQDYEATRRFYFQICQPALRQNSFSEYYSSVESMLFKGSPQGNDDEN
jgi:hypothetical protein